MDIIWQHLYAKYVFCAFLFVAAYILYRILLSVARYLSKKRDSIVQALIKGLRYPILVILLEIAAIITVNILDFRGEALVEHGILIIIIITIGWLLGSLARALFFRHIEKYHRDGEIEPEDRVLATQLLFLYRFVLLAIVALTIGSILIKVPYIRSVGVGILGSAGIAALAIGMAARPVLLNLIAGMQIAITKTIKLGDALLIDDEFARIEAIHLTHVITRTWDLRRIVHPISRFIDHSFENWDLKDSELLGKVVLYCDYAAPIEAIRIKAQELVQSHPYWNQKFWAMQVTECTEKTIEIRIIMTANDARTGFDLRCFVREKLIQFLQEEHPEALPKLRLQQIESP